MSLLLKQFFSLLKLLHSETGSKQIALGIACGLFIGFSPSLSIQTMLIFFLVLIFRIQIGAVFISAFFFKIFAYLLDPVFHKIGSTILELNSMEALFTKMYNMPLVPYTHFNNSIVMGSGVAALILFPFMFFLSLFLITKYRTTVVAKIKETRLWKGLKATGLYQWYYKYQTLYSTD